MSRHGALVLALAALSMSACASAAPYDVPEDIGTSSAALTTGLLEIHYVNVGWGGSVFLKGPDGTTVLLEAGNTGKGTAKVAPYLASVGLAPSSGLDYTIAGHQHCDHIGGLDEVVQAGYDVRRKNYYNGSSYSSGCVTEWSLQAATTTAGALAVPTVGTQIALGNGARLTFVAVNGAIIGGGVVSVSDENDRSIAVLVQYGGFDWLWASDLGGGSADATCTGRSTSQADVETAVIGAISPGGASPLITTGGIDVLHVNHHGSESSTNKTWMNLAAPALAVISVGGGQSSGWDLPRIDVVEHVLLAQASACVTAPPALVLQTEEGSPAGASTSYAGYSVGDIKISTDGVSTFTVSADGQVSQGPNETAAAALPRTIALDSVADTTPPTVPANLVATGGSRKITLGWTASTDAVGVTGYQVHRATTANGPFTQIATTTQTTFVNSGLNAKTTYYYRVKAYDAAGNVSEASATASAKTK
jgi:beta-lactamase superfamily II metal-dependent hydrolase